MARLVSAPSTLEVIVSTYERPDALRAVLDSLAAQSCRGVKVAVADDGSGPSTADVVREFAERGDLEVRHVWQEDQGFRLAAIRNRALATGGSDYVVFLDGDCIVPRDFVANHISLAERGYFVRGSRIALSRAFTRAVLKQQIPVHSWGIGRWTFARLRGRASRLLPVLRLPLGPLRKWRGRSIEGAAGANLGLWREDVVAVNGFDESFAGYGYEDWEFLDRLLRRGARRKNGRFSVPFYHLWHVARIEREKNRVRWLAQRNRGVSPGGVGLGPLRRRERLLGARRTLHQRTLDHGALDQDRLRAVGKSPLQSPLQ